MYELSDNFLTMYDPNYLEEHSDSSDFEDSCSPVRTPKHDYRRVRTRVHNTRSKEEKDFLNQQICERQIYNKVCCHSSRELWRTKEVVSRDKPKIDLQVRQRHRDIKSGKDRADQIDFGQQRAVRHKLIPCLSNMFRRHSNNVKQMSIIKENPTQNVQTDNGYRCDDCRCKERKSNRRQEFYTAQPVYAVSGVYGTPIPFGQTKITPLHLSNTNTFKNDYYDEYLTDSEEERIQSRKKRKKWRKVESEMKKQYFKKQKSNAQQCPSKQALKPYQFLTSFYQYHTDVGCTARCSESLKENVMASTSSSFWDYLMLKFNKKSQANKDLSPPFCPNEPASQPPGCFGCDNIPNIEPETHYRQEMCKESCNCNHNAAQGQEPAKPPPPPKVQCMCSIPPVKPIPSPPKQASDTTCRKCQQPHDEIIQTISEKYNGEILCIHNPPFILINGCLNLPTTKDEKQLNVLPMTEDILYCGQSSQYPPPCYDVHQCQIPEYRQEKIVQSLCSHNPPCEVVRTCVKPKYDPTLHNPCIHVPTCEKIAECIIDKKHDRSCPHTPKCLELPVCTRNYIMLTATENVGIQAKPGDLMCRHEPPCVLIPKCFARVLCDSCIPYDSIPDCVHRPRCEMIPACCRKSIKEMVSVRSRQPNGCRVA